MRDSADPAAHPQNLDLSLEVVFAVNRVTGEASGLPTVRTPTAGKHATPLIFEPRKAIVFRRNVE
jgi:hypothetical protein